MRDQDARRDELVRLRKAVDSADDLRPIVLALIEIVQELDDAHYIDLENLG